MFIDSKTKFFFDDEINLNSENSNLIFLVPDGITGPHRTLTLFGSFLFVALPTTRSDLWGQHLLDIQFRDRPYYQHLLHFLRVSLRCF